MTQKQDTLDQLNAARDQLRVFILGTTAVQGTPAWQQLEQVVKEWDQLTIQINQVLAAQFPAPSTPALAAAITSLQQETANLAKLDKTLGTVDQIVQAADSIVQIGTAIVGIVAAL